MAKQTLNYTFKNAQISLENNEIVEHGKEDIKTYVLSDILKKFEGENKTVDITIKETSELEADEVDGEE
ncbi:YonK family protein [Priestia sp. SB1]|uniref:YonK family protein n=1 Tax=Priestia sp. SB1 TaxID=3132359 RepID=UPI0031743016